MSDVLRRRRVPRNLLCFRNQIQGRSRQGRHVQRLADMAGRIGSACMVMEDRSARGEIEQRYAAQYGQRVPRTPLPENSPLRVHTPRDFSVPA